MSLCNQIFAPLEYPNPNISDQSYPVLKKGAKFDHQGGIDQIYSRDDFL
jgi:hypothetical protein